MASPQLQNGHTRIANEIIEAICRARLSGNETAVLLYALRQTYGWGGRRKTEPLHPTALGSAINMSKSSVSLALSVLMERGIITRDESGRLSFVKDHEKWSEPVQPTERKRRKPVQPTEPTVQPTERIVQPTEPTVQPTEPYKEKERKKERKKDSEVRTLTPLQIVIRGFKEAKGVDADNADWDAKFFSRHTRPAKELLAAFDGDPLAAVAYTLTKATEWEHLSDWGLEAIVKAAGREYNRIGGSDGREHLPVGANLTDGPRSTRRLTSSRDLAGDALRSIEHAAIHPEGLNDMGGPGDDWSGD